MNLLEVEKAKRKFALDNSIHKLNFAFKNRCKFILHGTNTYFTLIIQPIFILNPDDLRKKRKHCDTDGLDFGEYIAEYPIYKMGSRITIWGKFFGVIALINNILNCHHKHDILMITQYIKLNGEDLSNSLYFYRFKDYQNKYLDEKINELITSNGADFENELIKQLFARFEPKTLYNDKDINNPINININIKMRHYSDNIEFVDEVKKYSNLN